MDLSSLTVSIPTAISLVGFFIGLMTYLGNRDKNKAQQVRLLTSIDDRLGTIEKNTEAQGEHLKKHDEEIHSIDTRVTVMEKTRRTIRKRGN